MIEVHYFASIRERLGCDLEQVEDLPEPATVKGLIDVLVTRHGERWDKVLREARVLSAVNQVVAGMQTPLKQGDEVAFFPPVTGG